MGDVGDEQDDDRAVDRYESEPDVGPQEPEGQHDRGQRQRHHADLIEKATSAYARAHDDPADAEPERAHDTRGGDPEQEAVLRRYVRLWIGEEDVLEMTQIECHQLEVYGQEINQRRPDQG